MTWYVLAIRSQRYPSIDDKLTGLGAESYYPMRRVWRKQRTGPRKCANYPLIPSYLFVDVDLKQVSARSILLIDGVIGFLGIRGEPSICDTAKLDAIRDAERRGDYDETAKRIEQLLVGESMTIEQGPFKDFTGTITAIDGSSVQLDVVLFGSTRPIKINIDKLARRV